MLRYALPQSGDLRLGVFDLLGREVRVLASGPAEAGEHTAHWDGRDASGGPVRGGVYLVRLAAAGRDLATRFVLLR
jgi:flagellar hook assembly protein FlgD